MERVVLVVVAHAATVHLFLYPLSFVYLYQYNYENTVWSPARY